MTIKDLKRYQQFCEYVNNSVGKPNNVKKSKVHLDLDPEELKDIKDPKLIDKLKKRQQDLRHKGLKPEEKEELRTLEQNLGDSYSIGPFQKYILEQEELDPFAPSNQEVDPVLDPNQPDTNQPEVDFQPDQTFIRNRNELQYAKMAWVAAFEITPNEWRSKMNDMMSKGVFPNDIYENNRITWLEQIRKPLESLTDRNLSLTSDEDEKAAKDGADQKPLRDHEKREWAEFIYSALNSEPSKIAGVQAIGDFPMYESFFQNEGVVEEFKNYFSQMAENQKPIFPDANKFPIGNRRGI